MTRTVAADQAPPEDRPSRASTTPAASLRRTSVLVGSFFVLATLAYLTGSGLVESVTGDPRYLTIAYPDRHRIFAGVLLELVNCAAVVGIAVLLFPVLRRGSEPVAVGYLASRLIEAVILAVAALSPLLLVTLSRAHLHAGGETGLADTLGGMLVAGDAAGLWTAMIALGLGSLLLCHGLYAWRLVPRPIALLGFIGYACLLAWGVLGILLGEDPSGVLLVPGAVFELAFPAWLLARGLKEPAASS
jgi:Domain of unknown function (DUF4386)